MMSVHRCAGEAQAAQAAFADFMVLTMGHVRLMRTTDVGDMRCLCVVSVYVRHVRLHRSAQEQLHNQHHQNDRTRTPHNITQYVLD